jgi:ankyrin repeat protein
MAGGIDPTVKDKRGKRASDYMKPNMRSSAMIMASNYQDKTKALIDFVGLSSYDAVNYALSNGAKIDARDDIGSDGDTPLIIAIKCQDVKMISLLLNSGASLDVPNKKGKLPIQVAVDLQNNEIVAILRTIKINRELALASK